MTKRILLFLMLLTSSALADTIKLAPVVVKAHKIKATPETAISTKTLVTKRMLQKFQDPNLVDVLQDIPGISVVQSGGKGHLTAVFVRGLNPNHIQVRVDGMRADNPAQATGGCDFSHFSTEGLQVVEVERGAVGSLYGSDAIAGVIQLRTAKGEGKPRFVARAEGGSRNSYRFNTGIQGQQERVNLNLWLSEQYTRGIITQPKRLRDPSQNYSPDPYRQRHLSGRIGFDVNENISFSLFTRTIQSHLGYLRFADVWIGNTMQHYNRLQGDFKACDGKWVHEYAASLVTIDSKDKAVMGDEKCHIEGKRVQLSWYQVLELDKDHLTRFMIDYNHDYLHHPQGDLIKKATMSEIGCGLHHRWQLVPWAALEAGARYQKTNDRFKVPVTYRLATELSPFWDVKIRASFGTGVKLPTLYRLYIDQFGFKANPYLKPEHSKGGDLGISREFGTFTPGVTYFITHVHNMIETDYVLKKAMNIHAVKSQGIECFLQARLNTDLSARIDYTWMKVMGRKGELLRRPRHKVTFFMDYQANEKFNINSDITYVSSRLDIGQIEPKGDFRPVKNGLYVICALRVSYDLEPWMQLYGRLENVLNRRFENPYGYAQQGFAAHVGIKIF